MDVDYNNRTQEPDFLKIHFFKIKHQNVLCLFVSSKLRFPQASKQLS